MVNAERFYWRAIGGDWWISAVVVTDAAFVHGQTAQQLRFRLDYDQHRLAHTGGGGTSLHQRAAISPRVVRRAIELSRKCDPAFSGEFDLADVELQEVELRELQELARLEPPSFSRSPGLMALDSSDRDLVLACLNAAADGPFIPEWEFQTLFGTTRDEFRAVVAQWPNLDEYDNTTFVAINNALINLTGYPHQKEPLLLELCGADRTEILRVFTLWRDASAKSS